MDDVLGRIVQSIAKGEMKDALDQILHKVPKVHMPDGLQTLPTKDHIESVMELAEEV
jgi:hypothetical protein